MGNNLLDVVEDEKTNLYYRNYRLAIYEAKLCKIQSALYEYFQEIHCSENFVSNFFLNMKMYGRRHFTTKELEIIDDYLEKYRKINEEMVEYEDKIRVK